MAGGQRIDFEIVEQSIRYATGIALKGGTIQVEPHDDDTSSVRMLTRYELRHSARWVPRLFIDYVVAAMHKIVVRDMQARLATTGHTARPASRRRPDHALPTPWP